MRFNIRGFFNHKLKFKFINYKLVREFLAEFIGTLVLVTIGCAGIAQVVLKPTSDKTYDFLSITFAWGFGVFAGLLLSTKITGHINPAITFAMFLLRKINFIQFIVFMIGQYLGAFFGAAIVYFVYLNAINNFDFGTRQVHGVQATAQIFATFPAKNIHPVSCLIDQIVATSLLTLCVISITDKKLNKNTNFMFYPFSIGLLVVLLLLSFGHNCGAPLNPARDFSPRIFAAMAGYSKEVFSSDMGYKFTWFLVPLFAPYLGGLIGTILYVLFIGIHLKNQLDCISGIIVHPNQHDSHIAKFDEDDLEEEFIHDYKDKIYA